MSAAKLNDSLYELYNPPGKPNIQVVFFHGFQRGDYQNAHLSTWEAGDGSTIWPQTWLAKDLPGAWILTVSYEAINPGNIARNLLTDLIEANVGQDAGCPVILVGHSFGGLIMKELCLEARKTGTIEVEFFLTNVKGFLYYSTPHFGFPMEVIREFGSRSPLQDYLKNLVHLNSATNRQREDFLRLMQYYKWYSSGLAESLPTKMSYVPAFPVVPEASMRIDLDDFYTVSGADHFTVCRPIRTTASSYARLKNVLAQTIDNMASEVRSVSVHQLEELPRYPIGLETRIHTLFKLQDKMVIGLLGMSGTGKTTLATRVFNKLFWNFEYTCFLENVKGIPIHRLHDRLLGNFYQRGTKVNRKMHWYDLKQMKILIVLDDVNSDTQVEILPTLKSFGDGSKLIITSRQDDIFKCFESCCLYRVDELAPAEAYILFCQHAFGEDRIPESSSLENDQLEKDVKRVITICERLPLALELTGSCFRGHEHEPSFWRQAIKSVEENGLLRWSYDSLQEVEQRMFLEAATYFCGQPLDEAMAAWSTSFESPQAVWENLLTRTMVKQVRRSTWNSVWDQEIEYMEVYVHEQLRGIASEILEAGKGKREEANDATVLFANDNWLKAATIEQDVIYPSNFLGNFPELKYLDVENVNLVGLRNAGIPSRLSLLKWKMRSPSTLPSVAFEKMERLAVLELGNWKIPKEMPQMLENLTKLSILSLCQLEGLNELPANFGNLSRLKRLELVGLGLRTLPDSFGNLLSLNQLTIVSCSLLSGLSKNFGELKALEILTMKHLDQLEALPESFGSLLALKHLTLVSCRLHVLPPSFGELIALQRLTIGPLDQVKVLSDSIVQAYNGSDVLTAVLDIDWRNVLDDGSLRANVDVSRERNMRVKSLRYKLTDGEEEKSEEISPTCAKIFLCGYPEVGKTRLRKTLTGSGGRLVGIWSGLVVSPAWVLDPVGDTSVVFQGATD